MRLVWTDDFGYASTCAVPDSPRLIETVRRAAMGLTALGAEIEESRQTFDQPYPPASTVLMGDPSLASFRKLSREEVASARETRGRIWDTFHRVLDGRDFILSPTVQHLAPTRDAWAKSWEDYGYMATYAAHTAAANLLGWPAISVPAGLVDGMPVGLQIIGRPDSEARMFQLAQAFLSLQE